MLKIWLPFSKTLITQKFGDNANPLYAQDGLKGHPAYDWGAPWDSPVRNCAANAYCYSVMHENDPVLMDYRAVFTLVEDGEDVYELSYGHLHQINAVPGQTYQVGDILGTVGNTGPVYSGSHEVTEAEKDAGSHAGCHLHGPQVRPVKKVKEIVTGPGVFNHYLTTNESTFYKDSDGFYYQVINYDNGYNGCINFAQYSTETLAIDYRPTEQTVSEVIPQVATVIQSVSELPKDQQKPFFAPLKAILEALLKLIT